jgi:hypothetical protein
VLSGHEYRVFGLKVESDIQLPELFEEKSPGAPDVSIRVGHAGGPPDGEAGLHADGEALILVVNKVARYRIVGGTSVIVQPEPGVPDRNVRLFLLGSAFGALLHQRGLLPLHANAVEIDGKAIAFMGESGAGKSTLAAWFHDAGYRVLADDVCVIRFDETGRPLACPGLPRLRLWQDAINLSGRDASNYSRSYIGDHPFDKFDVPVPASGPRGATVPLAALYELDTGEAFEITRLSALQGTEALFANTYRGSYLTATNGHKRHWESAVRLVQSAPVFRAVRKWNLVELDEQCSGLLEHARELVKSLQSGECETP